MDREVIPDGVRLHDKACSLALTRPRRSIELLRGEGHATAAFVDAILAQRDTIVAECGEISIFDDLEGVVGYESTVRTRLTAWSREHREQIRDFHILTGSRLVAMGVTVANLALGGHIVVHLRRSDFDLALKRAMSAAK